jgi:hypothetical protein
LAVAVLGRGLLLHVDVVYVNRHAQLACRHGTDNAAVVSGDANHAHVHSTQQQQQHMLADHDTMLSSAARKLHQQHLLSITKQLWICYYKQAARPASSFDSEECFAFSRAAVHHTC